MHACIHVQACMHAYNYRGKGHPPLQLIARTHTHAQVHAHLIIVKSMKWVAIACASGLLLEVKRSVQSEREAGTAVGQWLHICAPDAWEWEWALRSI